MNDRILVTGAAGQLGRLVIKHLLARGVAHERIVAGSRSPGKLDDLAAAGVEVRKVDFDDSPGLSDAFKGIGTVLIVSTDALDGADRRLNQHRNAVAAAAAAGVGRIAYTSLPNPESSLLSFAPDHLGTEQAIKATGLPYAIFRNSWYHENLLRVLPDALKRGQWYSSARGGRTSYVGREDIAEAIAAALSTPGDASQIYTLTGSEALSNAAIAELAYEATGKALKVVPVTDGQFATALHDAGVPGVFVDVLVSAEAETRAGNLSIVTDHVEFLTGHAPKPLGQYLKEISSVLVK
ncbi:NAD(P)H dehydrogenase (quinone) [Paraburkholderia sp. GAS199]|uniref:NmrA family NAD(P)-binding protein n=1 Tax=Paraburkholderia sp. GAS199 TaxID=3035126 RepID=UPI003D23F892